MGLAEFKTKSNTFLDKPPTYAPQAIQQTNTEEEQEGFFQQLVKPASELGKDLARAETIFGIKNPLAADYNAALASIENLRAVDSESADELMLMLGERPSTKKIIADATGTALLAIPLPFTKAAAAAKISSPFLKTAIAGGGYVAAFNAADAASQDKELSEIAKAAGVGFLTGAGFGGAGYLGLKGAGYLASRGFTRFASIPQIQAAYHRTASSEPVRVISQYVRPVGDVLSKDFGDVGKDVVNRLYNADRNVQTSMGRVMRIASEVGGSFGRDDAGREASYQLGRLLRGKAAQAPSAAIRREAASQFSVAGSMFRDKATENLSDDVFNLARAGKVVEAAEKGVQVAKNELGVGLKNLGVRVKGITPTIGVYEGGREPSFLLTNFGVMDDKALGEIAAFGQKAKQDSMLVFQRKIGGNLITKADAQATPALRIKIPGLNADNIDDFRDAVSKATGGKLVGYLTGDVSKGEVVMLNVEKFDGLTRQQFENLATNVRKLVKLNKGTVQTFYTRNTVLLKEQYGEFIQKAVGGNAGRTSAAGAGLPQPGRITGRVSLGERGVSVGADSQQAIFGSKLPDDLRGLTPEQFYRALLGDIAAEAQSRGTMIRIPARGGQKAEWVKFESLENYFPQQVADLNAMKARVGIRGVEGRLRKWVLRRAVEDGEFSNVETAARVLDDYIQFVEKEGIGISKQNGWIKYLVDSGQAENFSEGVRLMQQVFKRQSLVKLGGSLEHARIINNPFYNPFPDEVVPLYMMDSLTRLETMNQFGTKYTGETAKLPGISEAIDAVRTADGRKAAERFEKFLGVAMNRVNNSTDEAKFSYYMRMIQVPKLAFAQIVNIGQSVLNPLLKTDAKSTFIGLHRAFTKEGIKNSLESGATIQSVFNEMVNSTAAGGNFADKFLKTTGFIWTEKFNRTVASNVGIEWARRNHAKLLANPTDRVARARLTEIGVNVDKVLARKGQELTTNELLRAGQIIAEKTQFRSRPLDLPIFASSSSGKMFWQFKNFMFNQFMFVFRDNMVNELRAGNYGRAARNFLVLTTVFPATGEVLQDIRSLVTQSRRPTGAFERYLSNLAGVGAFALVSDLVDSVRFDRVDQLVIPASFSSVFRVLNEADDPERMVNELIRQTGVGAPLVNAGREKRKGYESSIETLQRVFGE